MIRYPPPRLTKTTEGAWAMIVDRCLSCGEPHTEAPVVVSSGSVWYRCLKNTYLIYVREERKK